MGRPKKVSFPCSYCGKEFKRKINLKKHLLCHPGFIDKTRVARARSNWCPVCRRSFAESEYKLHIETEHKFDDYKIYSGNTGEENECKPKDFALNQKYRSENYLNNENKCLIATSSNSRGINKIIPAKQCKKRGRKPGKTFQNTSSNTCLEIKTEPPDTYETNVSIFKNKNIASNSSSVTCKLCNFKSKTLRGVKIHTSTIHKKKNGNKCQLKNSPPNQKTLKTAQSVKKEPQARNSNKVNNSMKTSCKSQPLFITNSVSNANQNSKTGMIYNVFPNQSFSNFSGITYNASMPNIQNSLEVANQNNQIETIPVFDCESEKYIKWIKGFINSCKMHKYPLTPMICQALNRTNEEITKALAFPENAMRKRANHFYFMKIQEQMSEIMAGQLRYSMNVVIR